MRSRLAKKDRFVIISIVAAFLVAMLSNFPLFTTLERLVYDFGVRLTQRSVDAGYRVNIIKIDDKSISRLGRWPWSRTVLAEMVEKLNHAGARAVGLQVYLTEPQTSSGIQRVQNLREMLNGRAIPSSTKRRQVMSELTLLERDLDADRRLAMAINPKRKNVILPMFFKLGTPRGETDVVPAFIKDSRIRRITSSKKSGDNSTNPLIAGEINYPIARFGVRIAGIGHGNRDYNAPGRSEILAINYNGDYYPSLALLLAARANNMAPHNIRMDLKRGEVRIGGIRIPVDSAARMYPGFYTNKQGKAPFRSYSFSDVHSGKVPLSHFRNEVVIIGPTATGVGTRYSTPISSNLSAPELLANVVTSILNRDFYSRPFWTQLAEIGLIFGIGLYLLLLMPRFGAGGAAFFSVSILFGLMLGGIYFLVFERTWMQTVTPALLLITGHLFVTTRYALSAERLRDHAVGDSAETNRMLGLTFQSQGQLDMAMDKFRKLPVDDSVLELFYNLALDFERKRQYSKAVSCYEHIFQYKKNFRDARARRKRAKEAESSIMIGGGGASAGGTLMITQGAEKPTLGRYAVEKELGRGAMGTVYLGRDPKINRVVAIKTLDLTSDFEQSQIQSIKERFFREAETAGRLNHPNIVTIYDAGEEHDLAYIAMEFLEGQDLTAKLKEGKKLPVKWCLNLAADVADALHYAHKFGVVHRDIKPANIMYNDKDQSVKVTDFGIARIADSNSTKSGVVLGTPSYMSPEQFAAKRVDGRSDVFSLGVTLFELLTGEQPFGGDSLAELMYQITNSRHPNIDKLRSGMPSCVKVVIDKALQKEQTKRFQSGDEFAKALRRCAESA